MGCKQKRRSQLLLDCFKKQLKQLPQSEVLAPRKGSRALTRALSNRWRKIVNQLEQLSQNEEP